MYVSQSQIVCMGMTFMFYPDHSCLCISIDHIIYGIIEWSGRTKYDRCGKIRGFSPMKFFAQNFRGSLATSVYYLDTT